MEIREIAAHDTLYIRHEVMWPDKAVDYVKLPNDAEGKHFGLFVLDKLVSVISTFKEDGSMQFRKFATLAEFQGKGYGTALLRHVMEWAENEGLDKIWCNARVHKSSYYRKFGLRETEDLFVKGGISYVVMEKIFPKKGESSLSG
ncbi:MAG: GNAT family N-acetyltransferase [Bacteroidota bacterium]